MKRLGIRGGVLAFVVLGAATPAAAQIPYRVFDERTEVATLAFHFDSTRTFSTTTLHLHMVLNGRGRLVGLREKLKWLPIIPQPLPHLFSPIELQRDVARLRTFYEESGFLGTRITYDVKYINDVNRVNVTLNIHEGRPITLKSVAIAANTSGDPAALVPDDMKSSWKRATQRNDSAIGKRFTAAQRARILGDLRTWWTDHGWAFATATHEADIDSATATLALQVDVDPGPRAHVDSVEVVGNKSVTRGLIVRTMPLKKGDWFSSSSLAEGQSRLFGLSLFKLALAEVPKEQPHDSLVGVRVKLEENPPRLFTGDLGYVSAGGGITLRGEFAHLNFTGGARTLRVTGVAQTGLMTISAQPEREYQLTVAYREPVLYDPRLSLNLAPFVGYRDNLTDRSRQYGFETTLIYRGSATRYLTFVHRYSERRVLAYRLGSGSTVDLATLLAIAAQGGLDLSPRIQRSTFGLSATMGRFDPTRPAGALQARPSFETTAPRALNTIEYSVLELPLSAYHRFNGRVALVGRARIGKLFPFGKTFVGDTVGAVQRVLLRDVLLVAGGNGSVRGWANGLLGPKLLNLQFQTSATSDSITPTGTDGYISEGGTTRTFLSAEARLPFPGLGATWGTHVFLDAGRVWTSDSRFNTTDPNNEQRWFYGTGGGVDYTSIVGPIRLSLGYKLNPSVLDVRNANDVYKAILAGLPVTSARERPGMRLHLYLSLGQTF